MLRRVKIVFNLALKVLRGRYTLCADTIEHHNDGWIYRKVTQTYIRVEYP